MQHNKITIDLTDEIANQKRTIECPVCHAKVAFGEPSCPYCGNSLARMYELYEESIRKIETLQAKILEAKKMTGQSQEQITRQNNANLIKLLLFFIITFVVLVLLTRWIG